MQLRRISAAFVAAPEICNLLDREGIPFTAVSEINWPAFPYLPDVAVRMALGNDSLLIHYRVREQAVLARYTKDGDPVWTDSCVETFILPEGDGGYYNIECTCIGTLLIAYGAGRSERQPLSAELLGSVDRWASLGRKPLGLVNTSTQWDLTLAIPYTLFGEKAPKISSGDFRLNVYKCGDDLPTPHFVSLYPISASQPDFHRPDSFREPEIIA